jgi:pimeloyl-ACP methyl ester carboxylesterase
MAETRERFIDVRGLRVRYLDEGSGPLVLLLHGASLGSSADVWASNLGDFAARGLHAIAPDLPGFGWSDNPEDHSIGFRTRFVADLLRAIPAERAAMVGHSQSGRIAVTLALERPEVISKVVVVGTASLLPPLPGADKADAGEGEEGGTGEPSPEETRAALEQQVFHQELITSAAVDLRYRMSVGKNFAAFLARREAKGGAKEKKELQRLWQRLGEVAVPMRLIYGKQDRSAPERAALVKQLHPNLDLHLVDRCGHLVQWDAREELARLAGDFLAA